ncbi:isocitrate/isopropylmalate dehydrogenase family protein [Streptomyces sp. NPDC059193]|uniref:isocitrate/isopropylmalate dehydrogenase family protein n=1 Tax=Streptomyces sp. NPDC059193 TaxID=3346763 RepID=UPI0036B1C04C
MKIAVVPGDGIGQEVVPPALDVLALLGEEFGLGIEYEVFGWGADQWLDSGVGLPEGALGMLADEYAAVFLGALGDPRIPDMAHGRDILLGMRRGLDLYVNHRPLTLPTGVVDVYRENTQGLYAGVGGTVPQGGLAGVAIDQSVYTRPTVEKFVRYCLRRLAEGQRRRVVLVHKSNAVPHTGRLWQEVFRRELEDFPQLEGSEEYVDSFCYNLVRDPSPYEGVVTSNLFGDIISDIGAALMGGLGLAASASVCPETGFALFEPVHGSAPDIAGKGVANPYAALLSLAMMLDHLGHGEPAAVLRRALAGALGSDAVTPDLGGSGTTALFTAEVTGRITRELGRRGRPRAGEREGARRA